MKRLTCEMCGSNQLLKQDNQYVCQSCGASYTTEEARKLLVDVPDTGTNSVKASNTYKHADKRVCTAELLPINKVDIGIGILLSIVTCGIYGIYWEYLMVKNIRALKHDKSSCTNEMLCLALVPFYSIYWFYTRGKFVNAELSMRKDSVNTSEVALLMLSIFGLDLVALAIMQTDFNSLNSSLQDPSAPSHTQTIEDLLSPVGNWVANIFMRILPDNVIQQINNFSIPMYVALSAAVFSCLTNVVELFSGFYFGFRLFYIIEALLTVLFYVYTRKQSKKIDYNNVPKWYIVILSASMFLLNIVRFVLGYFFSLKIVVLLFLFLSLLFLNQQKKQCAFITSIISFVLGLISSYQDTLAGMSSSIGILLFAASLVLTNFALISVHEEDNVEK